MDANNEELQRIYNLLECAEVLCCGGTNHTALARISGVRNTAREEVSRIVCQARQGGMMEGIPFVHGWSMDRLEREKRGVAEAHPAALEAIAYAAHKVHEMAKRHIDPEVGLVYRVEPGDMHFLGDMLAELDKE